MRGRSEKFIVIRSNEGFYVGDISYILGDDVYQNFWGAQYKFADGLFTVNPITHLAFAVAATAYGTAYGDGVYYDNEGNDYAVSAGNIGLVPLELAAKERGLRLGQVFLTPGAASFHCFEGTFTIKLPKDLLIRIDTR